MSIQNDRAAARADYLLLREILRPLSVLCYVAADCSVLPESLDFDGGTVEREQSDRLRDVREFISLTWNRFAQVEGCRNPDEWLKVRSAVVAAYALALVGDPAGGVAEPRLGQIPRHEFRELITTVMESATELLRLPDVPDSWWRNPLEASEQ